MNKALAVLAASGILALVGAGGTAAAATTTTGSTAVQASANRIQDTAKPLGGTGLATPDAYAAGPGGAEACPGGNVCLYYNSPQYGWGSWDNWSPNQLVSLAGATFGHWGNGSGWNQTVYRNAASIVNNTGHTVWIEDADNHTYDYMNGYAGTLNATTNNDVWLKS